MTAVERITQAVTEIKSQRVAWLKEKPYVRKPSSENAEAFLADLRAEWAWYRAQRTRLRECRAAIQALIDDCELSMEELEGIADKVSELREQARLLEQYASEPA